MQERKGYWHDWDALIQEQKGVSISRRVVTVYGRRYNADGWSDEEALFVFRPLEAVKAGVEVMSLRDQAAILADEPGEGKPLRHGMMSVGHLS